MSDVESLAEIHKARIQDWDDETKHLIKIFDQYRERYRVKICSKCVGTQQQKDRNCIAESENDSNGNLKTWCFHMDRALNRYHAHKIYNHINMHPFL